MFALKYLNQYFFFYYMGEVFLDNTNQLIEEKEWVKFINSLKTKDEIEKKQGAIKAIKQTLINAIKIRVTKDFGLLFSGGIDSTTLALILKKLGHDFTCYSVGMQNSKDILSAQEVAKELGLKLKTRTLNIDEVEKAIQETTRILREPNVVKVGVGAVFYEAMKLAKENGEKFVFTGLGSEEIFAGYERHVNVKDVNKECWNGLLSMLKRDIERDYLISKAVGIELKMPFLDKDVIKTAMMIPGKFKISKGYKKYILREVALDLGLKKELAFKKKRAAQYGTGFDKAMLKIAKQHGFKYKGEYLKSLV